MPNQFLSLEGDLENYFFTEYWLIDQYIGDTLWEWGDNSGPGQLGNNTSTAVISTPITTFAGGTDWKQVAGGGFHSAAVKIDGTLWTWGSNGGIGQLGDNTSTDRLTPVTTFSGGTNWKQVSCGNFHTAAIKTDGTLWTWGDNGLGQLGDNTTTDRCTPVTTFSGGSNWKQVTCGANHTIAIKNDGTLWIWGLNDNAQMGDNTAGSATNKFTPVTTFAGGTNWKQVASTNSSNHSAAVKTDGTLWTWGKNSFGQLGNNTTTISCTPITTFAGGSNWKQVAVGNANISAIKTDGTLWTWGRNSGNQTGVLGVNDTTQRNTPVTTFAGGSNWKQVSVGYGHMVAIKTDGTLWNWGIDFYANLGTGNPILWRCTPVTTFVGGTNWKQVSAGYYFTMAVTSGTDPTFFVS